MTPALSIAIILFIVALSLTIWANSMLKRAQSILKDSRALSESAQEEISVLNSQLKGARSFQPQGYPLKYGYCLDDTNQQICVYGEYKSKTEYTTLVYIKGIPLDEDIEFSLREALELIDYLNEK